MLKGKLHDRRCWLVRKTQIVFVWVVENKANLLKIEKSFQISNAAKQTEFIITKELLDV